MLKYLTQVSLQCLDMPPLTIIISFPVKINFIIFFSIVQPNIGLGMEVESQDGASSEPVQTPVMRHVFFKTQILLVIRVIFILSCFFCLLGDSLAG